jgi:hypothetical protein
MGAYNVRVKPGEDGRPSDAPAAGRVAGGRSQLRGTGGGGGGGALRASVSEPGLYKEASGSLGTSSDGGAGGSDGSDDELLNRTDLKKVSHSIVLTNERKQRAARRAAAAAAAAAAM